MAKINESTIKKVAVIGSGVMGSGIAAHIANSNTNATLNKVAGSNGRLVAAWNFAYPMASGSYIEIKWSCNSATGQLQAVGTQTAPARPATPSVIATLTQIA